MNCSSSMTYLFSKMIYNSYKVSKCNQGIYYLVLESKYVDIFMIIIRDRLNRTASYIREENYWPKLNPPSNHSNNNKFHAMEFIGHLIHFKPQQRKHSLQTPHDIQYNENDLKVNTTFSIIFEIPALKKINPHVKIYCARNSHKTNITKSMWNIKQWMNDCKTLKFGTSVKCECSKFGFINVMAFDYFYPLSFPSRREINESFSLDFQESIQQSKCERGKSSCTIDLKFLHLTESYSRLLQRYGSYTCRQEVTESPQKGNLIWPEIMIGRRYAQKCYYPSKTKKFAFHDCLFKPHYDTFWTNYYDADCPYPPLSERIKTIRKKHENHYYGCFSALEIFQELVFDEAMYPEYPMFDEDCTFILNFFFEKYKICWPQGANLNLVLENVILKFLDMMLSPKFYWTTDLFKEVFIFLKESFLNDKLDQEMVHESVEQDNDFSGKNLFLSHRIFSSGYMTHTFNLGENNSTIAFSWDNKGCNNIDISTIIFPNFEKLRLFKGISEENIWPEVKNDLIDWPGRDSKIIELAGSLVYLEFKIAEKCQYPNDWPTQLDKITNKPFSIIFENPYFKDVISKTKEAYCARYPYQANITIDSMMEGENWMNDCKTLIFGISVKCECSEMGFIAVLSPKSQPLSGGGNTSTELHDLSTFLGFPYQHEVYLTGLILRAISIVAMLITVVTFLVFRKARRGVATHILLNLCFSLICLLVVLYLAEQRSNIKRECRIYNILKYYLILVSLMWNGIEAHNMHRMLIKVFNIHMRYFVRKAVVVAWGLPFIMVCITLIFDIKAFDGIYVKCTFRCSMRPMTMYLAWLLPMSTIILHNLIIFGLVLKVLCKDKSSEKTNEKTSIKSRLTGACGVLVLLGVPWILSPFGAIQRENLEDFESVIGVIFIVFVSLQGVFIFLFHCVRNPQVRSHWWSTFNSVRSAYSWSDSKILAKSTPVTRLRAASL